MAEQSVALVLEALGYHVRLTGVERMLPDVTRMDHAEYHRLALPDAVRRMPDLIVHTCDGTPAVMIEVKFSRHWDLRFIGELREALTLQQRHHPGVHTVVLRGREGVDPSALRAADAVRVVPAGATDLLRTSHRVRAAGSSGQRCARDCVHCAVEVEACWTRLALLPTICRRIVGHEHLLRRVVQIAQLLARP